MGDLNEAQKWLEIAEQDYAVAFHLRKTFIPMPIEVICFHCQQAVEKSLKAVLAYNEDVAMTLNDVHRPLPVKIICFHCKDLMLLTEARRAQRKTSVSSVSL